MLFWGVGWGVGRGGQTLEEVAQRGCRVSSLGGDGLDSLQRCFQPQPFVVAWHDIQISPETKYYIDTGKYCTPTLVKIIAKQFN